MGLFTKSGTPPSPHSKLVRRLIGIGVAAVMLITGGVLAYATNIHDGQHTGKWDGHSSGGIDEVITANDNYKWPTWQQAEAVLRQYSSVRGFTPGFTHDLQRSMSDALHDCKASGHKNCRLFAVGATITVPGRIATSDISQIHPSNWEWHWDNGPAKWTYYHRYGNKTVSYRTFTRMQGGTIDQHARSAKGFGRENTDVFVILLDEDQPPHPRIPPSPPRNPPFQVTVSTNASKPRILNDQSQEPTHDVITTRVTKGKFRGTLSGTVTLHYDGGGTNGQGQSKHLPAKSASRRITIRGPGKINSPTFKPTDLGLPLTWQTGHYWYDVNIPKTKDCGGYNTPNNQHSESFDIHKETFGLDVSTSAVAPSNTTDNSTDPTHDVFHVSADHVTHGDKLNGTISLHYDGGGSDASGASKNLGKASTPKQFVLDKTGDSDGPTYRPSDLGMTTWQTGHYWYDVTIPKQGRLNTAVQTSSDDPDESFDIGMQTVHAGVSTTASAPANQTDNSTDPTHDTFHVSGDFDGTLTGTISLHYDGGGTTDNGGSANAGAQSAQQSISINSTGDTDSPTFHPSDLGMTTWQSGHYWYDVQIPAQGRLTEAVQTDSSDPSESFDIRVAGFTPNVTTAQQSGAAIKSGDSTPVHDSITMSGGKSDQSFTGTVTLHYADNKNVPAASVDKQFTISGAGTAQSPDFTPADFGWTGSGSPKRFGWQSGTYWFTVHMDQQGRMGSSVQTADRDPSETFTVKDVPPAPPTKKIEDGHVASGMPDQTVISSQTGRGGYHMTFVDKFTNPDKLNYTVTNMKVTDATDKSDWTSKFKFSDGSNSPAQVSADYTGSDELPLDHTFQFTLSVTTVKPGEENKLTDKATVIWNTTSSDTDEHHFTTHKPAPNKVWVLDKNGALKAEDVKWTNKVAADVETFLPGDPVAAVVNGRVPADLVHNLSNYQIVDDWTNAAKFVDFSDVSKAAVFYGGQDVTSQFDIKTVGTTTVAVAKPAFLADTAKLAKDSEVKLVVVGAFKTGYTTKGKTVTLTNGGSEQWNDHKEPANNPPVFTWTPNPDKAWVLNSNTDGSGKWQAVIDNAQTNKVGGDGRTYRDGDPLGFVVNGTVPKNLALTPDVSLSDDYGAADYVWDPAEKSQWKVYDAPVDDDSQSTVSDIITKGCDVTSQFTLTQSGTKITAQASQAYESGLVGLKQGRQIVLLVPGRIAIANGKGNQQAYKDISYTQNTSWTVTRKETDKDGAHGEKICVVPKGNSDETTKQHDGQNFVNTASETAGKATVPTNKPPICVWVPNVVKTVTGTPQFGGDDHNADNQLVRPGQPVNYGLHILDQVKTTNEAGYPVKKVVVDDTYDPVETVDANTITVTNNADKDPKTGKAATLKAGDDYNVTLDKKNHRFQVNFTDSYINSHWAPGDTVDLNIGFTAVVSKNIKPDYVARNRYTYTVNNSVNVSNEVDNKYRKVNPVKADTQKDPSININGKRALLGDKLYYRLTLDAANLAYNMGDPNDQVSAKDKQVYMVQRLGMIDDYDEKYLSLNNKDIKILDPEGKDVTAKFNIQVENGVAYVFAKTVDTTIPATKKLVKGDPQPTDLKAYWHEKLDKLNMPYIDQKLLGRNYQIVLPMTVIKVTNGYDVKNVAIENVDDQDYLTNQVHNPLVKINPRKDVVVNVGDKSCNGMDIYLHHYFLYRLDSGKRPTDLAYPVVSDWKLVDKLDPAYDRYTGQWAVYANADLYSEDGQLLAKKGEKIAGTGFNNTKFQKDGILVNHDTALFTAAQATDGTVTVAATSSYRLLASADAHPNAWSAYLQVQRMKPTTRHNNQFTEVLNGQPRPSNIVWTRTPDLTPSIRVEKYDLKSGLKAGDRNHPSEALSPATDGTRIGLLIVNTGHSDLHKFGMADQTIAGNGIVAWNQADLNRLVKTTLKPGQSITVKGTLHGVTSIHTDRANVVSSPILPCPTPMDGVDKTPSIDSPQNGTSVKYCDATPIKAHDDWNGKNSPLPLANTGVKVATILLAAILLALIGLLIWMAKRNHTAGKPSHAK